jgi:integrase
LSDPVDLWFAEELAVRLRGAGFLMIGQLRDAIARGGRWWRGLTAFGPIKAHALADQVGALVGWPETPAWSIDADARANTVDAAELANKWITARTSSAQTARAYRREVQRLLVWLTIERRVSLVEMTADDCTAYIAFLKHVPVEWMSRRHARRFEPGWAPFAGQPSLSSQHYALTVINAFFTWLLHAGCKERNPWELVNLRLADDPAAPVDDSRAFTPAAWAVLQAQVQCLPQATAARMRWLLTFTLACGLRATELLRARRADVAWIDGECWLRVHGKGARNRVVPIPSAALAATREYFSARGLNFDSAHPNTPLLAALTTPVLPETCASETTRACPPPDAQERAARGYLSYPTLAAAFKRFTNAAIAASMLPSTEREHAYVASLHWLRHTHATRAAECDVPIDVLQANLGQSDPRTTARYYRAQRRRRTAQMERVFGVRMNISTNSGSTSVA